MRTCKHCAHDTADHLAFCSACGHWLGAPTSGMSAFGVTTGDRVRGTAAFSRTMVAVPRGSITGPSGPPTLTGRGAATTTERTVAERPKTGLHWASDAIGYIYVYLRDK